jgi:hypothetical protein
MEKTKRNCIEILNVISAKIHDLMHLPVALMSTISTAKPATLDSM